MRREASSQEREEYTRRPLWQDKNRENDRADIGAHIADYPSKREVESLRGRRSVLEDPIRPIRLRGAVRYWFERHSYAEPCSGEYIESELGYIVTCGLDQEVPRDIRCFPLFKHFLYQPNALFPHQGIILLVENRCSSTSMSRPMLALRLERNISIHRNLDLLINYLL
jgi:hypothetical protein